MSNEETQNPFEQQGKATSQDMQADTPVQEVNGDQGEQKINKSQKFKKVKFHTKSDKNQPNDVVLSVNGVTLLLQRDTPVILPESFLEAADHATYSQFQPGTSSRKVIARVSKYPYEVLGDATKEEFERMRSDGVRRQEEARKREEESIQVIR